MHSLAKENNVLNLLASGISHHVSDGSLTKFWKDNWLGDQKLQSSFPRLFRISNQQDAFIQEMGHWMESSSGNRQWKWSLNWRRALMDRELASVQQLLDLVKDKISYNQGHDKRVWNHDKSGNYSTRSFSTLLSNDPHAPGSIFTKIWNIQSPPRVQFLLWLIVHQRVNTKDRLRCLHLMESQMASCSFCGDHPETIDHLFLKCPKVYATWQANLSWWKISWVSPNSFNEHFIQWLGRSARGIEKIAWALVLAATVWSVWEARNNLIFEHRQVDWEDLRYSIKIRTGQWIKGSCKKFHYSPRDLVSNLHEVFSSSK